MAFRFGKYWLYLFAVTALCSLLAAPVLAGLDAPHNAGNGIGCLSCHDVTSTLPKLMPSWTYHEPAADIDDTLMNAMCWSCHTGSGAPGSAPLVLTHSSLNTSDRYGDWTVQCWVCHGLHTQDQLRKYGAAGYLFSGISTGLTATTLTKSGAGWEVDAFKGMLLVPNTANVSYNYTILANTADTLTVRGPIDLSKAAPGNTFAIVLGKLIRSSVNLGQITDPLNPAAKTGSKTVRLFRREDANSFADGNGTFDGICEVCHTETRHFRNDGGGDDPLHANVGGAAGSDCFDCHSHENGFAHGGGSGTGCVDCHGHDAGSSYDSDMTYPNDGADGTSQGRGTVQSHSTHTETSGDDLKGPGIYCDTCHDITNFPSFKSGTDSNGDGRFSLAETDVCNACHSSGGTYDGLDDPVIGAKKIWKSGAYVSTSDSTLQAGKETWCATCHDESPSQISGVNAPNVIGDEDDSSYFYGGIAAGWGFYKTGHGLADSKSYPASGGWVPGAGLGCNGCHDFSLKHVDSDQRTYTYNAAQGSDQDYRHGYRLIQVDGQEPMAMPRDTGNCTPGVDPADFRLCFKCHDSEAFSGVNNQTNFRTTTNAHNYHLNMPYACGRGREFASDWDSSHGADSRITCVTCHNVHGSTQLSMVRDGKLVDREPGLKVVYYKPGMTYVCGGPGPQGPSRFDVTLNESTGTVWDQNSASNLCGTCHGSCGWDTLYSRAPVTTVPPRIMHVYGNPGSNRLGVHFSNSVYTDTGATGDLGVGDFTLTDTDNGRSITGVSHDAGDTYAILTLSSALDSADDIAVDTLAAATAASIYDSTGRPMGVDPALVEGDSVQPALTNMSPASGTTDISIVGNITFTLSDSNSGIDWTSLSVTLTGTGYNESYTEADAGIVAGTGNFSSYDVTVNPAVDFPYSTVMTVTVDVLDMAGNQLPPSSWSFTTEDVPVPVTQTLHPSGLSTTLGDGTITANGGVWADILDTNDGDTSHVYLSSHFDGGGPTFGQHPAGFKVAMDDAPGMSTISEVRAYFTFRYSTPGGGPPATYDKITLIIDTGGASEMTQEYHYTGSGGVPGYTTISISSTTDPDGGPWELADIQNLRAGFKLATRENVGWITTQAWVTEVYVEVDP